MRDRVKQVLLDRILEGIYKPGDRLVELQLARELDTSQGPVREALRDLEAMRLVESVTYRGTRVRAISQQELQESYQVRAELEGLAGRLAAPQFLTQPESLQMALQALEAAAQAQDFEQFTRCNAAFHRLIVETAGNSVLLRVWSSLDSETWTRINLLIVRHKSDDLNSLMAEHRAITEALIQGKAELAEKLLCQHVEIALSRSPEHRLLT